MLAEKHKRCRSHYKDDIFKLNSELAVSGYSGDLIFNTASSMYGWQCVLSSSDCNHFQKFARPTSTSNEFSLQCQVAVPSPERW